MRSGRRIAVIAAIVAFLALDAVLVVLALSLSRTAPETPGSYIIPTPLPVVTSTPEPSFPPQASPPQRFLSVLDATTAWRVDAGTCPASPVSPELTTNGGGSWTVFDATGTTAASQVLDLEVQDSSQVVLLTLNSADCLPQYTATYTGGEDWAAYRDSRLAQSWYIQPTDPLSISSPSGTVAAPCTTVALSAESTDDAAILCREQVVFRTTDGGASWDGGIAIPGAVSLDDSDDGYVVAATGQETCAGVEVRLLETAPAASDGAFAGCYETDDVPAQVAISAGEGSVWVWADTDLGISLDGGASW